MITRQSLGLDKENADPKPVTGFDYAGQPMKPNEYYNGRPEHMNPNGVEVTPTASTTPTVRKVKRKRIMSPERKAKLRQYMHDYWQRRKAAQSGA